MDIPSWLAKATADADARGLPELKPLLETLARSTQALRDADEEFGHPAAEHAAADHAEHAAADHAEHAEHAAAEHAEHSADHAEDADQEGRGTRGPRGS